MRPARLCCRLPSSWRTPPYRSNGIVRPEVGNPNDMLLDYIQEGAKIAKGDSVVTSGFTSSKLDSLFPRDIARNVAQFRERFVIYQSRFYRRSVPAIGVAIHATW